MFVYAARVVAHQRSLFATGVAACDEGAPIERCDLADGAWIDLRRGWVRGSDAVLDHLIESVEWRRGRRRMFDRVLDDPRLSCWYRSGDALPHPLLVEVGAALSREYRVALPTVGLNYYRDGSDSVAFHADRELRELDDTVVAIVTFGTRRPFLVRRKGGGRSIDLAPGGGDLLVMGGTCQRDFEHAVPKARRAGPRVSATWRGSRPRGNS